MTKNYHELRASRQDGDTRNIKLIANRIQRDASTMFSDDFEIIVGLSDLVVKSHFRRHVMKLTDS